MKRKRVNPLITIELDAERKAQEYKRKLIKEALDKLAAEESEAVFSPEGDGIQPDQEAPADADDDGGRSDD